MLIVISSAKTLDLKPNKRSMPFTLPDFLSEAQKIIQIVRNYSPEDIQELLKVNYQIAVTNIDRYHKWHLPFTPENSKHALLTYKGEVYRGIQVESYSEKDFEFAQHHLRIISGLYGLLRPMDLIQPYRMEMNVPLNIDKYSNLTDFWKPMVTEALNKHLVENNIKYLINLASNEYFSAIDVKQLKASVITPVFYELKNGQPKSIVVYLKKARGLMTSFIIKNRLTMPDDMKAFDLEGYTYSSKYSNGNEWAFVR